MTFMKKPIQRFTKIGVYITTFALLVSQMPSPLAFAESDTLYVTPSSSQMNIGTPLTVNIKAFSDTNPASMSVSGNVTYPTNLLQVTSTSVTGSDFAGNLTITPGNGAISFNGQRTSGQSGLSQIFTITFQTKAAGTAIVGFDSSSRINGNTTSYKVGTYTITNPSPPPAPAPSVSTAPKPVVSTTPTPTPTTDNSSVVETPSNTATVDPSGVVDSVQTTALYKTATVTWKVNASNPSATFTYGTSSTQLDKQGAVQKTGNGTFSAALADLTPGEQYYFSISGTGTGVQTGTYTGTVITEGYPITITVTENNIAAANAQIQINSTTYTTHSDGKVTIGLAAGSYTGTITTNTATLSITMAVAEKPIPTDGTAPAAQAASFNLTSSVLSSGPGSATTILLFVGILLGGTAILVFGVLFFINYRRRKFDATGDTYAISHSPSVIIEDDYTWQQNRPEPPSATPQLPAAQQPEDDSGAYRQHANAIYLNEEEPLDMFEQARLAHDASAETDQSGAAGQSSSPPRSTTP